ncbi:hypothetical protein SBOR_6320 [Sclerotinia borealis F-4128]|uniref:2-dehydropantoate 2-reductase n=1 Tax=Sclerotinia borealis (strain F-4128) TaxID=1432307 RepID=W9C937_SCLBF|nr:hypothetical protein SBOR_6320 [Sclerotinia borealis F-4128]
MILSYFRHPKLPCFGKLQKRLFHSSIPLAQLNTGIDLLHQPDQNSNHSEMSPTIHILGVGNIGKLCAHSLATKPQPPPLTLLLHRPQLFHMRKHKETKIGIYYEGAWHEEGHYDTELIFSRVTGHQNPSKTISNLIVTTKAHKIVEALSSIKFRLTATSTVLFIHNGMGVIEDVNKFVFPDAQDRPHYLFGIASHGVYRSSPFAAVLAGHGNVTIGNPEIDKEKSPASSYLLQQVVDSELLQASEVPWDEFRLLQLQKLAVNAVINPLTALHDCINGKIVQSLILADMGNIFDDLVSEISRVFCSLPELEAISGLKERFSTETLRNIVLDVASVTASNRSSMLQDISNGRKTEIQSINGYIVKRANKLGIPCPMNEKMVADIRQKSRDRNLQIN